MKRKTPNNALLGDLANRLQAALAPKVEAAQGSKPTASEQLPPSGRRSTVYTPQVISKVLSLIESGHNERQACEQSGLVPHSWSLIKQKRPDVWERVIAAKAVARKRKLEQEQQQLAELRSMRKPAKAALRPISRVLPRDIQLVRWYLVSRVSLDTAELTRAIVEEGCIHYGTDYARWLLYDEKHHLMEWIYKKRS